MRLQMRQTLWVTAVMVGVVMVAGTSYAQAPLPLPPSGAAQAKPEPVVVPLQATVVITRYKSDKAQTVVSRMPFEVWVNTGGASTVMFNSDVPVPTTTFATAEGAEKPTPVTTFNHRSIGTQLTIEARALADGRFSLGVSISDSQIVPWPAFDPSIGGPRTANQNHRAQATLVLRDGQTVQHSLTSDRVSGDLTKVEVTLNVVK